MRESDTVRVIDALVVYKDAEGDVSRLPQGSQLSKDEADGVRRRGRRAPGSGGGRRGRYGGGRNRRRRGRSRRRRVFDDDHAWDVLEELPNDAAAALILLEHRWAIGLRDAAMRAGGFSIAGHFISPLDLVEVGLVCPEEAEALAAADAGR